MLVMQVLQGEKSEKRNTSRCSSSGLQLVCSCSNKIGLLTGGRRHACSCLCCLASWEI